MATSKVSLHPLKDILDQAVALIGKSFGPNALKCLLRSDTGKLLVTSHGAAIVDSLQYTHPLGKMFRSCVLSHHQSCGDGSKEIILILQHVINWIYTSESTISSASHCELVRNLQKFCDFFSDQILPDFMLHHELFICTLANEDNFFRLLKTILLTFFSSQFSVIEVKHITELMCETIQSVTLEMSKYQTLSQQQSYYEEYVSSLMKRVIECPGNLVQQSEAFPCLVIQRTFLYLAPDLTDSSGLKYILLNLCSEGESDSEDHKLLVRGLTGLTKSLEFKKRQFEQFGVQLQRSNVKLIIVEHKADNILLDICRMCKISVIQYVPKEDVDYLSVRCNIFPVTNLAKGIDAMKHIGDLDSFSEIVFNGKPCVRLERFVQRSSWHASENCDVVYGVKDLIKKSRHTKGKAVHNNLTCHSSENAIEDKGACCNYASDDQCFSRTNKVISGKERRAPMSLFQTLVICGPSPGVCHQLSAGMRSAFRLVGCWIFASHNFPVSSKMNSLQISCKVNPALLAITGGGAFELKLYRYLQAFMKINPMEAHSMEPWCAIFSQACLTVPAQLLKNSCATKNERINVYCVNQLLNDPHCDIYGVNAISGTHLVAADQVIEPLAMKFNVMVNILTFLKTVIKLEHYVHVKNLPEKFENSDDSDSEIN